MAAGGLVQKDGQPEGAGLAFPNATEKKILGDADIENGIDQQHVATLEFGMISCGCRRRPVRKKNFPAGPAGVFDVPDVLANKVKNDGNVNGANKIGSENKRTIHGDDKIESAAARVTRDFAAKLVHARGNSRGGICGHFTHSYDNGTSVITTPCRVELSTANSAETGKPRVHAIFPPEVRTGQETLSQRLTPHSFRRRDILWRF